MTKQKPILQEVIVVEGKADLIAVRRAVEAECIVVNGFAASKPHMLQLIEQAQERVGVILFTDPDSAGEHIRRVITERVPDARQAHLPRAQGRREKDGKIGIEYASPQDILEALTKARARQTDSRPILFTQQDLMDCGLTGDPKAGQRRRHIGQTLGIGYTNAKQFLNRLNSFGITHEEFLAALKALPKDLLESIR